MILPAGTRVGTYEVIAPLGAGGMGVVYRARDGRLGRTVAVKLLPAALASDPERLARFEREARAASSLNHPNIVTIHDVGTLDDVPFLVMEFVEGHTLRERIAQGPVPIPETLRLAAQVAAGLARTHEAGIVHRDLKPDNVMVNAEGLVKILDFGLAKLALPQSLDGATVSLAGGTTSADGRLLGTPAYMSPEQARGEAVDARSDQFALGLIVYEMLSGRAAFKKDTPLDTLAAILRDEPPPLDAVAGGVPERLLSIVARCLAKRPADRYASTRDLARDLEELARGTAGGRTSGWATRPAEAPARTEAFRPARRRWAAAGAGVIVLALIALGAWIVRLSPVARPSAGSPTASGLPAVPTRLRRSAAVLGFKNLSQRPEAAWLSTALAETLSSEIAAGESLRVVPGEAVWRMKAEASLADSDAFTKDTLQRMRTSLGTDVVVLGSYLALGAAAGGRIRLDVRVQETTSGETVASLTETGTEAELLDLVARAGTQLRGRLAPEAPSPSAAGGLGSLRRARPDAVRLYSEGLARLRRFDALEARDLLRQAVAADPGFALAHSALAEAWSALGYDARATAEAKRAFELSEGATREERLLMEARYRQMAREWDKAIEIYRTLWNFFPDEIEYGLSLAKAELRLRKTTEAQAVVEALRKLPPPARDDPRLDLMEGEVAAGLSDPRRQQAAAARAAEQGRAQGARLLVAEALLLESTALRQLGQVDQAKGQAREAQAIYESLGHRKGAASAMTSLAILFMKEGNVLEARRAWEEALAVYRDIGDQSGVAANTLNLANVLADHGDLETAVRRYGEVLALTREIGRPTMSEAALANMGETLARKGDYATAQARMEEALSMARAMGDKDQVAASLGNLALLLRVRGDLATARRMADEGLGLRRETGYRSGIAIALSVLADMLAEAGDLEGARQRGEESLAIRRDLGEKTGVARSQLALAALAIEQGRAGDAEAPARAAADRYKEVQQPDGEAEAGAILARALRRQARSAEALTAARAALAAADRSRNAGVRLAVRLEAALVRAMQDPGGALPEITSLASEAAALGHVPLAFDARLALGEVEIRAGRAAAGRRHLQALESEARGRGFRLVATHAASASAVP